MPKLNFMGFGRAPAAKGAGAAADPEKPEKDEKDGAAADPTAPGDEEEEETATAAAAEDGDDDDDKEKSPEARQARARERARIGAIMQSPEASVRREAALSLALNTDMTRRAVIATLAAMPKDAKGGKLDAALQRETPPAAGAGSSADTRSGAPSLADTMKRQVAERFPKMGA